MNAAEQERVGLEPHIRVSNPERRNEIPDRFYHSTLDDVGPVGGDQGMAVLKEMNDLESGHDELVKSLARSFEVK
jgi:uncharacterized protein YfeS